MFDFQRFSRFSLKRTLSPQGLQQSLSPGAIPIDNAAPCFPHDNIVGCHLCDECMKSNKLDVGHTLLSTSWWHEQARLQTEKCEVYQFWPNASTSRQFVSILWTILLPFQVLPFFEVIVVQAWSRVCRFTISSHTFLRMTFHVIRPSDCFCVRFFTPK